MARIVTKKKRKISFLGKALIIFFIAFFVNFYSSIFISARTISYEIEIQKTKKEIAALEEENEKIIAEIQGLQSKERIYEIANQNDMHQSTENIITVER